MSGDDGDPTDDETADDEPSESVAGNENAGDADVADGGSDRDTETPSPSEASDREAFGIASDLVTGHSGDDDDVEPTGSPDGANSGDDADDPRELVAPGEPPSEEGAADGDAPLSSLASSVSDRRADAGERPDDELFDQEDVPEIDADVVWERLGEDEPPDVPSETEHDVRVIEKRSYCEQCPFFSTPPDVGCEHEGTEILELVDMEHFRVVDCPKVLEDERLERL